MLFLYAVKCFSNIYFVYFHVCKYEKAFIKDWNALRIFVILCIYLGEVRGCTNAWVCMRTHSQPLIYDHLLDVVETWYG